MVDMGDDAEIADLLNEFYVSDLPKTIPIETGHEDRDRTKPIPSNNTIESVLDKYTIDLIVQLANEVGLFKEKLDAETWPPAMRRTRCGQ